MVPKILLNQQYSFAANAAPSCTYLSKVAASESDFVRPLFSGFLFYRLFFAIGQTRFLRLRHATTQQSAATERKKEKELR